MFGKAESNLIQAFLQTLFLKKVVFLQGEEHEVPMFWRKALKKKKNLKRGSNREKASK